MTNGEKLQKIFSNLEYEILSRTVITNIDNGAWFSLEWWNAEYKEPTAKNNLGVDYISREQAIDAFPDLLPNIGYNKKAITEILQKVPPVTPREPRKGHWIYDYTSSDGHKTYHCSECGCYLQPKHTEPLNSFKWCSLCGADMREVEE